MIITALCYMFPYTGDDWTWGSYIGIDRLNHFFQDYNGRYVGNMIVLALTRSRAARTLVMTICLCGTSWLIAKISECGKWGIFTIVMLIFSAPKAMFRQSIVWTSGFSNYVTSVMLVLICVLLIKSSLQSKTSDIKWKNMVCHIVIFALGYLGALIVEHVTLMQVLLSGLLAGFIWWKTKKRNWISILWFGGSVLGALTMFSNGNYSLIAAGGDSLRTVAVSADTLGARIWNNYFNEIGKQMILDNMMLELLVAAAVTKLFVEQYHDADGDKRKQALLKVSFMGVVLSVFYGVVTRCNPLWDRALGKGKCLDGCVNAVFWCALFLFTLCMALDKNRKQRMLFILIGIFCANMSLLLVTPIGPRCFFATYILMIWYCMECLAMIQPNAAAKRVGLPITLLMALFVLGMNFVIYSHTYEDDRDRLRMIQKAYASGETQITVPKLTYDDYVHYSDINGVWGERYKLFYGIPQELEVASEE